MFLSAFPELGGLSPLVDSKGNCEIEQDLRTCKSSAGDLSKENDCLLLALEQTDGQSVPTAVEEIARLAAKSGLLPAFQASTPEKRSGRAVLAAPLCRGSLFGLIGLSTQAHGLG